MESFKQSSAKKGTAEWALTLACHPKFQERQKEVSSCRNKMGLQSGHLPAVNRPKISRKENESVFKQSSASKGAAERSLTRPCHPKFQKKQKEVSPCNRKMGPLSGHLQAVNRRNIHPKGNESFCKNWSASKRESWAGTYDLSIVEIFSRRIGISFQPTKSDKKGQLSGHLHTANRRIIQPKEKG